VTQVPGSRKPVSLALQVPQGIRQDVLLQPRLPRKDAHWARQGLQAGMLANHSAAASYPQGVSTLLIIS
jgi:hypothetical protein